MKFLFKTNAATYYLSILFAVPVARSITEIYLKNFDLIIPVYPLAFFISFSFLFAVRFLNWIKVDFTSTKIRFKYSIYITSMSFVASLLLLLALNPSLNFKGSVLLIYTLFILLFFVLLDIAIRFLFFRQKTNEAPLNIKVQASYVAILTFFILLISFAVLVNSNKSKTSIQNSKLLIKEIFSCKTNSHRIQVIEHKPGFFTYLSWNLSNDSSAPDLKLVSNEVVSEGSQLCKVYYYNFRNGDYLYKVGGEGGCGDDNPDNYEPWVYVFKNSMEVSSKICRLIK